MSILEVKNLRKIYGKGENEVHAVDDVTFSVEEGEFLAITGASGSGKSTLLHMIGGVDKASSGEVIINGENITKYSNDRMAVFRRKKIGIIYQFYNLIPVLNVAENISLPAELDGLAVDQQRLADLLEVLGLTDRKEYLPNQLSGGQQQRVAIGRALYNYPAIIIADEPTGNLDRKASDDIIRILLEANRKYGQTIILVTHDLRIAEQAQRIIEFEDGKIISDRRKESKQPAEQATEQPAETVETSRDESAD